jgi:ligand-binding sensor domain-containing protein
MFKDQTFIISFDFLDDSDLLVGTNTGLLFCRLKEPGMIEIIRTIGEIPESKIAGIQKMRTGSGFYIATESDGVFQLTHEDNLFRVSEIIADPDSGLTGIQDIYEDSRSNLWLASFGNGLIKINFSSSGELKKIDYFNNSSQFVTNNVKTVFEDREGIIWSGNYGEGLTQITPKTFYVYTFDKNLYGNNIFSIWSDKQYRWIGTENGLVKLDQPTGKIVKFYGKGSGLPKDTVTAIYSTDGKELWIGTEKNGVFRMETVEEKFIRYPVGNGALENSVTTIAGKGEEIWVGTKKGLCNINSLTGKINWYSISQGGLPHNFIRCLFIDSTGKLWISTRSNILTYFIDDKVFKIQLSSNSGVLTLGPITEDTNSRIWVGSIGNGVFRVDADSIINFTTKEGLLSNYCYSLIFDDDKNLWIGHKDGLSRIGTTDFSVKPVNQIEGLTDSYQFNSNAINKDQQGKIWFGSSEGMVLYDQSMEYSKLLPPVLGITSIRINDEEREYADKILLSPGNYKLRIDFLGINLKEPSLVTYQYQLEGYDQSPEIMKSTYITYNRLIEGDYKFVLRASSGDGVVSVNPLTVNILIKKPIWKKLWFYLVDLLLLIILTYIYIKRREYKFLAEKKILEEKVKERTYEIQCQKNEIEQQRDLIDEKNENITSSIKYASNIQNAVLPSFELIDKL